MLSGGATYQDDSPELTGPRSPWRQLEALAQETGQTITTARIALGVQALELDADGHPLVCGQCVTRDLSLTGAGARDVRYRWICRQEPGRWVWAITDGLRSWEVTAPPGVPGHEDMPIPSEAT